MPAVPVAGSEARAANAGGSLNTAVGSKALRHSTGEGNVAIGFSAGLHATDGNDTIDIANSGGSEDAGTIGIGTVP